MSCTPNIIQFLKISILLFFFSFKSIAQQKVDIKYLNNFNQPTDSLHAESIVTIIYFDTLTNRAKQITKSKYGFLKSEIYYSDIKNQVMHGLKRYFYESGKIKLYSKYENGNLVGAFKTFYPNGKLKRIEKYKNGILKTGKCYSQNGKDTSFYDYEIWPSFPGSIDSLKKFIVDNIIYTEDLFNKGIFGQVLVRFIITKEGFVSNVTIAKSVDPILDGEAIRVISLLPKWTPGFQDGQAVPVEYSIPITFEY